jgi:hypothetical protein
MNPDTPEQALNKQETAFLEGVKGLIPYPIMICGVNRKINTGNFENIDVFSGIGVPIMAFPAEDLEAFKESAMAAADLGFSITSTATGSRYNQLKELQSGGKK